MGEIMELDNRAVDFIQRAKAQGFSKDEVAKFLQDKGYDIGETPKYSALDKAKYMGRAGAEGLTLGAGDVVGGYTNILANNLADVTHGKDLKTRLKGAGNLALNLVNPGLAINRDKETFNQGRKDFVEEQEQFAQAHPGLNFAGELAGGLILGGAGAGKNAVKSLAKPTLWNMVKSGARTGLKEGAKWGAGYGFGSGLTEDANELNVYNALKGMGAGTVTGAVLGAGLGGALPVGIAGVVAGGKGIGKGATKVADYFRNKTVNTLVGANKGLVEQSIKEGKPLIDIADQKLMDVAEGANLLNREAKQTFADYGKARIEGQHPKLVDTLGQYFDPRGSHQLLDDLNAQVQEGAKTLYDKAKFVTDKAGNIVVDDAGKQVGKVLPELEKLNKYEMDYISQVYRTKGLEYEVQGLPQNDMRILDYAKQLMDDDIQQLLNKGKNRQAAILAEKRASFIAKIDKANPEYKTARNFFERGKRAENALQAGRSALSGERENLAYDFNKLTPEEKFYFRQGVGNKLEELSNQKTEGGNVFQKVFNAENRRRLKGLDIKNYADLEKTVLAESKAASNINSLRGGSPTADRLEAIKRFALGVIRRPTRTITNVLANTAFKPFYANPAEVAKAMTDPVFLSKLYAQAEKNGGKGAGRSVIEALNQIGRMAGGTAEEAQSNLNIRQIINDATKPIKNKGGYIGEQPKVSQMLTEKQAQLKRDLKILGYNDDVFYTNEIHKPSDINLSKINEYKKVVDGKHFRGDLIDLGETPQKLLDGGLDKNNLYIGYDVISKAQEGKNIGHDLPKEVLKEVPEKLYNPIAVLKSRSPLGGNVVITELKDKAGKPVVTALRVSKTDKGLVINDIKSIHGREDFDKLFGFSLDEGKLTKIDANKMESIPSTYRAILAHGSDNSPNHSILDKSGNVKTQFLDIAGVKRPTTNSEGQPIARTVFGQNNFWNWLDDSIYDPPHEITMIGEKPKVFYHNSNNKFNTFDNSKIGSSNDLGWLGKGHYFFGDKNEGQMYGKIQYPVYLKVKNPYFISQAEQKSLMEASERGDKKFIEAFTNNLKQDGYDAVYYNGDLRQEIVVFDPNQIKSVKNQGTFNPKNPNIYKSLIGAGGLGSIAQILNNKEAK